MQGDGFSFWTLPDADTGAYTGYDMQGFGIQLVYYSGRSGNQTGTKSKGDQI